jgi:Phage integrase family
MGGCRPQKGRDLETAGAAYGMREASSSPARLERRSILDNVAKRFTTACRMAKIGKWHPHELQHTAASLMLANGIPLRVVSDILGHASIRITSDVYGHVLAPRRQEAAEVLARFYAAWTPNRSIYSESPSALIRRTDLETRSKNALRVISRRSAPRTGPRRYEPARDIRRLLCQRWASIALE